MSDNDFPDLPSDEELGLSEEDLEALEDLPDAGPEMSAEEMASLLGEAPKPPPEAPPPGDDPPMEKKRSARPPDDEGPRSRWRGLVTLALLIVVSWFMSGRTGLPKPVPANAPDTAFSSARAMSVLVEIARAAHPTGSPEHTRVREYLMDRLRELGLEPEVQTATSLIQNETAARAATIRNVVARMPGTASTGAIVLTAHYDSREIAVGAADDGSGVVTILETLRALQAGAPLQNDIIVLFTDAEELGLLGARAFVDEHPWMEDVRLVLSFEMRGGGGPSIMFETGDENGWVLRALRASDPAPFANSISYEVYQRMPNNTDFTPFKEAGLQGLNFAAIDNAHVYHQEYDVPEKLSEATLQHHGLHALGVAKYLGTVDLTEVNGPNVTYFNVPILGLIVYDGSLTLPLTGIVLLLFAVVVLLAMRAGARPSAMLFGLGVSLVGGASAFGVGAGLMAWLPVFHPEMGSLQGSAFHSEGWYVLAITGATLTIVTLLYGVSRRWLATSELAIGGIVLPLAGAVWLSWAMPLGAMNLQWPVAAALLAVGLASLMGRRNGGAIAWGTAMLLAVPVLVFMVPLVELLWLAMTFRLAGALGVLIAATLFLMLPALEGLRHPNSWWAPVAGLVLGGAALGMGLLAARPNAARPAPSTLVYAYEHGTAEALWATDLVDDSTDLPAREWAVARAGSAFGQTRDLSDFGYQSGDVPVTVAPVVEAAAPWIGIENDTTLEGTRRVVLGVRSQIGAELIRFQFPEGSRTRLVSLDGKAVTSEAGVTWAEHWGVPDPIVILELEMPAGAPIELNVIEHTLRPEELLGAEPFARPPYLAPDIVRQSDRAMFLTRIATLEQSVGEFTLTIPTPSTPSTPSIDSISR